MLANFVCLFVYLFSFFTWTFYVTSCLPKHLGIFGILLTRVSYELLFAVFGLRDAILRSFGVDLPILYLDKSPVHPMQLFPITFKYGSYLIKSFVADCLSPLSVCMCGNTGCLFMFASKKYCSMNLQR